MNNPVAVTPLSGEQVALLKKSFRQLNTTIVANRFYVKLFERYPEVKKLFPADIDELGAKLMSVFELVVFSFEEKNHNEWTLQESVIVPLRQLGRKHDEKGVEHHHYAIANALLIEAIRETNAEIFTSAVEDAWKLSLAQVTDAMLNSEIHLPADVERATGVSLRDTFSYIRKRLMRQPG